MFKKGDKVKCINKDVHWPDSIKVEEVYTFERYTHRKEYCYVIDGAGRTYGGFYPTRFELSVPEELTPEKSAPETPEISEIEKIKKQLIKVVGKNGKIFTVDFIKKDLTPRVMNCRLGVKSATEIVKGFDNLIRVYDVTAKGYRTINLETVKRIAGAGQEINFK